MGGARGRHQEEVILSSDNGFVGFLHASLLYEEGHTRLIYTMDFKVYIQTCARRIIFN
jgi:hypothetical protein